MSPSHVRAEITGNSVRYLTPGGQPLYADDAAHFRDGVLRLLGISEETFRRALTRAAQVDADAVLSSFADALTELRGFAELAQRKTGPAVIPRLNGRQGVLWLPWVAKAPEHGVARSHDHGFGWLVRRRERGWAPEDAPPPYEEPYFEGDDATGVYTQYEADEGWRIEKGRRQLDRLKETVGLRSGAALDLGSGYGYFRVSLEERGFSHLGVDVSRHAIAVAARKYGFETRRGTLATHLEELAGRFDLVTLWDVLEHVHDPERLLSQAAECLKSGGMLALRTPSIACPEADLLGPHYHSLQRPHLVYFTPASVRNLATSVALEVRHLETTSHFLRGFVGVSQVASWAATERGSDITAVLQKRGP